jgi:hypothetical protein
VGGQTFQTGFVEDQFSILLGAPKLGYSNLHHPTMAREISVG